jgi:hypothetical protein
MSRILLLAALLAAIPGGCISKRIDFVPFLPPVASATLDELVSRLNAAASVSSLVFRVDLQFETVEEAEKGRGRKYHTAKGRLLLERPGLIRLNIEAPILSANVAEMASDGRRFQLLIHPPEYRALIVGSNQSSYQEETERLRNDPDMKKAGPLVNIRPQHFTDAFLLSSVSAGALAFVHEELVIEPDRRPGAAKGAEVRVSYYVVTVVPAGAASPRTQFWFDRTSDVALSRQRVFGADGRLVTDVLYSDYLPPEPASGRRFASRVRIERPHDDYALVVNVQPDGILVDRDLPDTAFEVTAPPEWGDTVRRIDLDERKRSSSLDNN